MFRNPPLHEVVKRIEDENAAEKKKQRQREAAEKRLKEEKEPVIDALNNLGVDFSKSFTITFRPGQRQELPDSTRDRWHHLAFIDVEFSAGDGSLRMLRGTTEEYPHVIVPYMAPGYTYKAPPASREECAFELTVKTAEGDTGKVTDMEEESANFYVSNAYNFAWSAIRQLQHYHDMEDTTITYFDGPVAEPLDKPKTPRGKMGPVRSASYPEYHYPPAC